MAENVSIAVAALSIMINFLIFAVMFGTGIGKTVLKKYFKKFSWRKQGFLPVLFLGINNVISDKTVKADPDGKFRYGGNLYSVNPRSKVDFEGIPHGFYIEGTAEPIDLHGDKSIGMMSSKMLERIILNAKADDLLGTIKLWAWVAGGFIVIATVAMIISLYFNWQIYDIVVQSGTGTLIPKN